MPVVLSEEQRATVAEAFHLFGGPAGLGPAALLPALRGLGLPAAEDDLPRLRHAAGAGDPVSLEQFSRMCAVLRAEGAPSCERAVRLVWEACQPADGRVLARTVRELFTSPAVPGGLTPADWDALAEEMGVLADGEITLDQFRQLVQPPAPLI